MTPELERLRKLLAGLVCNARGYDASWLLRAARIVRERKMAGDAEEFNRLKMLDAGLRDVAREIWGKDWDQVTPEQPEQQ